MISRSEKGYLGRRQRHGQNFYDVLVLESASLIIGLALEKFGMVANVVIARFTPLKFIFFTEHHTFYMAYTIGIIGFGHFGTCGYIVVAIACEPEYVE